MEATITTIGDVFKQKVKDVTTIPTIWVDFDGVEHQDVERDIVDVFTFSKREPSDYRADPSLPSCAYVKQLGPHVTKAYKLVHPSITKDFTDFNPEIFKYAFNLEVAIECFFNLTKQFEIPADLFSSCTKLKVANAVFSGCYGVSNIPSELFANCPKLVDVSNLFNGVFHLSQIPEDLFKNNHKIKKFNNTFSFCANVVNIPAKLFSNCPEAESFAGCFSKAVFTQEIPEDLFKNNTKAYDFSRCFVQRSITNPVSENLFDYLDLSQPEYHFTSIFSMSRPKFSGKNPVDFFKEKAASLGSTSKIFD